MTGATSGIGREIARQLAALGATVVLVGRGEERAARSAQEVAATRPGARVEPLGVRDLADRAEMRRVAETVLARYPRIDLLVNNAGGIFAPRQETSDGVERTFALNVLAPFVLMERLGGRLRSSGAGRVVNVTSAAHRGQHVDFDDLEMRNGYRPYRAYGRSKLELLMLTREFARRWGAAGPAVLGVHPGVVRSGFGQNNGRASAWAFRLAFHLVGRSEAAGAATAVFAATDPALADRSGSYVVGRAVRPGSPASRDPDTARRLYDACARLAV